MRGRGLLLERLVQPVFEQRNPLGCIDAGRLARMSDLRLRVRLRLPAMSYFSRFAKRFVAPSHCLPRGSSQGIVAAQMGVVKGCPMSALGQKQTFPTQNGMSALPQ